MGLFGKKTPVNNKESGIPSSESPIPPDPIPSPSPELDSSKSTLKSSKRSRGTPIEMDESYYQASNNPLLIEFRNLLHINLMSRIDVVAASKLSPESLLREMQTFVSTFAHEQRVQLNEKEQNQVAKEIVDDMVGFGPLEGLLSDESVTDIMVNGPEEVYVERSGRLQKTPIHFRDGSHLMQIAQRIANRIGRRVDESSPMVDARLPDGSRVNIIVPPVCLEGVAMSIRKFARKSLTLDILAKQRNMSKAMAEVLKIAASCRLNILVSGGTGSGKTTLLNALSQLINVRERVITIEDAAELQLQQPHIVRLESRPTNLEGEGEVSIRDLLKNALRMRPDRIIIGEVRGIESLDMLQAMNTGHDGSMSTIHANGAREAITRLENMVAMAGLGLPAVFVRSQIAGAIQLIVQIERMRDGHRRITEITEITGMEGDVIATRELFRYEAQGEDDTGKLVGKYNCFGGRPHFTQRAISYGMEIDLIKAMQLGDERDHEGPHSKLHPIEGTLL